MGSTLKQRKKHAAYMRRWRLAHLANVKERASRYRKLNRAKLTEYARKHRRENADSYNERARIYREKNRDKINARRSATRLIGGLITPAQYDALLLKQNGVCAICKTAPAINPSPGHLRRRTLWVDHDHSTKVVRGLLCHHCNAGIGHFRDDPRLLRSAISYLKS